MKIRYKGTSTFPIGLAANTLPAVTYNNVYEVIRKVVTGYVVYDDVGKSVLILEEYCEIVEE